MNYSNSQRDGVILYFTALLFGAYVEDSILVPEEELRVDVDLVTREYIEGTVTGDGVRLRAEPSTSGTVLELMYKGERVRIDNSVQAQLPYGWMRVQRIETGRWGYVSWDYINEDGVD